MTDSFGVAEPSVRKLDAHMNGFESNLGQVGIYFVVFSQLKNYRFHRKNSIKLFDCPLFPLLTYIYVNDIFSALSEIVPLVDFS